MHRTMNLCLCVLLAAAVAVTSLPAYAGNWPQFRGPDGQGHAMAKNLPVRWGPTTNVRWSVGVPGKGWSSPIVDRGRVFLTSAVARDSGNDRDQTLRAICIDAATGDSLWNVPVFEQDRQTTERIHGKNSHASPTPVTDGTHLYVHFGTQGTACLTTDGEIVWKTRALEYRPQHGNGGSPILLDDLLVVICDGSDIDFVVALDRETGDVRWKKARPRVANSRRFSFGTPLLINVAGEKQIVCPGTDHVIAYNPQTGREIWTVEYDGYSVIPRPVYGHGLVFVCTGWNVPKLLAIRPDGRGNVTDTHLVWKSQKAVPNTPSLVLVGNELYFISDRGVASCVDARTGKVYWTKRIGGNYSASPIYADGKIYFQSEQGKATVIRPGKRYVELARNHLNARTFASYAVAESALFIRTEDRLFRIGKP